MLHILQEGGFEMVEEMWYLQSKCLMLKQTDLINEFICIKCWPYLKLVEHFCKLVCGMH